MTKTEREKMAAGEWYACVDPQLDALRASAQAAVFEHNSLPPMQRGDIGPALRALLGSDGDDARIESPFYCSYGFNILLGRRTFLNAGCTILDTAPVRIGSHTMIGPSVQIYCADHHRTVEGRRAGQEIARPVTIGDDVWIGGGAVILCGVTIGDGAIVGAGAVVTRDVPAGATAAGNPARPIGRR
jgi:maltose O-acetyltransferase